MQQQLGKYTVVRRLGAGGMAEVFLCRLVGIGGFEKHVVLKQIRADIAEDSEFITMFFDEARLAANLNHPNIIQVFEVDALNGTPYIAMEYARGATLSAVLQKLRAAKREIDLGHLAFIFAGVCAGLDHAHNALDAGGRPLSIVHRDVSPQNIIVSIDGTPKIFDFGVAKARGSLSLTGADRVKGKFAYMAPEQLRAQPVDAKADIYAVGVCMYEAITGRRPFAGGTEAELYACRLQGRFVMPSELAPTIPVELEHLILSAMAPDPADRPTALELHESLARFCGIGAAHASNAQAVAAWLKELVGEQSEAYEGYSGANPSMTPVPRSANLPSTTNAVEASSRSASRGNRVMVGVSAVALGLAAVLAIIILQRDTPSTSVASAPGQPEPRTEQPERELERVQREPEPSRARVQREPAVRTEPAAAVRVEAAARATEANEKTVKRKQAKPIAIARSANAAENKVVAAGSGAVRPPAGQGSGSAYALQPGTGSGSASGGAGSGAVRSIQAGTGSAGTGSGSARAQPGGGSGATQIAEVAPARAQPAPPHAGSAAIAASARSTTVAPVATPMPVRTGPGSLDATPGFSKLAVDGSLTTTEIQSALGRTLDGLRGCYRAAAKRANHTPDVSVRISFEIDEGARATSVRVSGDTLGVSACVKDAIAGVRTRVAPDVGTVSVTAVVRFKPIP